MDVCSLCFWAGQSGAEHEEGSLIHTEVHFTVVLALRGGNWEPFHDQRHLALGHKCLWSNARLNAMSCGPHRAENTIMTVTEVCYWLQLCATVMGFLTHVLNNLKHKWQSKLVRDLCGHLLESYNYYYSSTYFTAFCLEPLLSVLYFSLPFVRAPPPLCPSLFFLLHCTPLQFPERSGPIGRSQAK